jgi:hypothetical protein
MSKIINRISIIEANKDKKTSLLYESIHPYLKSLYTFYKDAFNCEPVLMVTDVYNACQYVKIIPANDFNEAVCNYIGCQEHEIQNNDNFLDQFETINFNSKMLIDFIK